MLPPFALRLQLRFIEWLRFLIAKSPIYKSSAPWLSRRLGIYAIRLSQAGSWRKVPLHSAGLSAPLIDSLLIAKQLGPTKLREPSGSLVSRNLATTATRKIVYIARSYDFSAGILEYLETKSPWTILRADGEEFMSTSDQLHPEILASKSRAQLSQVSQLFTSAEGQKLVEADTWLVDWGEDLFILLSKIKPPNKKLVVRIHRWEAFDYFPYLADWTSVDGLFFVSDSIRNYFYSAYGGMVCGIRSVVARNSEVGQFQISRPRSKTIGVLTYANIAKNPEFALEVLRRLNEKDCGWTLRLAGPGFSHSMEGARLERNFWRAVRNSGQEKQISVEGFVENPVEWYLKIGYILSSSIVEGSHEAIVEGVNQGCVPVIRDWPLLHAFGGARGAYPELSGYVIENPEDAADLIIKNFLKQESIEIPENPLFRLSNISTLFQDSNTESN